MAEFTTDVMVSNVHPHNKRDRLERRKVRRDAHRRTSVFYDPKRVRK